MNNGDDNEDDDFAIKVCASL